MCAILAGTPGFCYCHAASNKVKPVTNELSEGDSTDSESNSRNGSDFNMVSDVSGQNVSIQGT